MRDPSIIYPELWIGSAATSAIHNPMDIIDGGSIHNIPGIMD
jgi:hypothetical protein